MKAWIALSLLILPSFANAAIRPFQTDYCTRFPDGTPSSRWLWKGCCIQHDLYLWAGGTKDERLQVDRQLRDCVLSKGAPVPGWVMYLGVRIGSMSPIRYKEKEWGNAWNLPGEPTHPRYQALTSTEIAELMHELQVHPSSDLSPEMIQKFFIDLGIRLPGI